MEQWIATGHTVTVDVPAAARGTLSPLKIKPIVVDAAYVRAHLAAPGFAVVDGRDASLYDGVKTGGIDGPPAPDRTHCRRAQRAIHRRCRR